MSLKKTLVLPAGTLIEILLSLAVLAILVTSIFTLLPTLYAQQARTKDTDKAYALSDQGLQAVRAIRDKGWANVTAGSHGVALNVGTWSFSGTEDVADGAFHRVVTVTDVSATQKRVVSTVTWQSSGSQQKSVQLITQLTDWRNASACKASGDWSHPTMVGSIDFVTGVPGTGVVVNQKMVYASGDASRGNKKDFYVIDAHNANNPSIVSSISTVSSIQDIVANGTAVYAADRKSSNQLLAIDVSAPASPIVRSRTTASGVLTYPQRITVGGNYAYIGSLKDDKGEFGVFDISNKFSPVFKASLKLSTDVNGIAIYGNRAYVATPLDNSEIRIINITNPAAPTAAGQLDLPGNGDAHDVFVNTKEKRAYVARDVDNQPGNYVCFNANPNNPDYYIPLKPSTSGSYPTRGKTSDSVTVSSGSPTSNGYLDLDLLFSSLPSDLYDATLFISFDDLDLKGDTITSGSNAATLFEAFTLKDGSGNVITTLGPSGTQDNSFSWQYDLPDPLFGGTTVTLKTRLASETKLTKGSSMTFSNTTESMKNIKICGYTGGHDYPEITVLDLTNPDTPTVIGGVQSSSAILRVTEDCGLVFASCDVSNAEFQVFSVQNLASPVHLSSLNYSQNVNGMALDDNIIYTAVRSNDAIKMLTAQ